MKREKVFSEILAEVEYYIDSNGIFYHNKGKKKHLTNFSKVKYLYNMRGENGVIIRMIRIHNIIFHLCPDHLISVSRFKKLLLSNSKFRLTGPKAHFELFIGCILKLELNIEVKKLSGIGYLNDQIIHLGNRLIIAGESRNFQSLVYIKNKGYQLDDHNLVTISNTGYIFEEIWEKLYEIYGKYTYIIIGFTIASAFFKQIKGEIKSFPILGIFGASEKGKSSLSRIIVSLFGIVNPELVTVNCDSSSTRIGMEEKFQQLYNIPVILNEISSAVHTLMKVRFDGEGAVKSVNSKNESTKERAVHQSTIAISVNRPTKIEVDNRCVHIDFSNIEERKEEFDLLMENLQKLSRFVYKIYPKLSPERIIKEIKLFRKNLYKYDFKSRLVDIFSILGGALIALSKIIPQKELFPDENKIQEKVLKLMYLEKKSLDPLYRFLKKLSFTSEKKNDTDILQEDEKYIFVHLERFHKRHFSDEKTQIKKIIEFLHEHSFIAEYSNNLKPQEKNKIGDLALSYTKELSKKSVRCFVLVKEKIKDYLN